MTTNAKSSTPKLTSTQKVMAFILEGIEANKTLPWDNGRLNADRLPINHISGAEYRGMNLLLLACAGHRLESPDDEWVTALQAKNLGTYVRRGQHGCPIVFFQKWDTKRRCPQDEDSDPKDVKGILRNSYVFDITQLGTKIEPKRKYKEIKHTPREELDNLIETFAKNTNLTLKLDKKTGSGYYQPSGHLVSVAALKYYKTPDEYYSTLFHELIHSTAKELSRKMGSAFGGDLYSKEEIVAECGAMLLCWEFGFKKEARDNSVQYIQSWSQQLKDNADWLIKGMSQAQKAVNYFFEKANYAPNF